MSGSVLFVLNNVMVLIVAIALAELSFGDREPWRKGFAVLAAFPVVALATLVLADTFFGLSRGSVSTVVVLLGVCSCAVWWRRQARAGLGGPGEREEGVLDELVRADPATRLGVGLSGGLFVAWMVCTLVLATRFLWDDYVYHAALPARWLTNGSLSFDALTFQSYYPLNAELFSLWFLLPVSGDGLASAAVFFWGLLACASIALLASRTGGSPVSGVFAVGLFLLSSVVWDEGNKFSASDLAATASLLA